MNTHENLKIPEPVYWSHGMLLSPQHFQQQELHIDKLTTHKMSISQPYYWGLIDIDLSGSDLLNGLVRVSKIHAVLPDGEVIDFSEENYGEPIELDLGELDFDKNDNNNMVTVYVGVVRKSGRSNGNYLEKRYEPVNFIDVVDENNADQIVELQKKKLKVKLVSEPGDGARYTKLPICRLGRNKDKTFSLTAYHPPMLNMQVSRKLFGDEWNKSVSRQIERLTGMMREKAMQLIAKQSSDPADKQIITSLLSKLPHLEILLKSEMSHPFQIYLSFVDLVSSFLAIHPSDDRELYRFVEYKHDDPAPGFLPHLQSMSGKILNIKLEFSVLKFDRKGDGVFEISLPDDADINEYIIDLVPKEGQRSSDLMKWLAASRIGTLDIFERLRKQRISGAQRKKPTTGQKDSLPEKSTIVVLNDVEFSYEDGRYKTMKPGEIFRIQGNANDAPAAIHWYRKNIKKMMPDNDE